MQTFNKKLQTVCTETHNILYTTILSIGLIKIRNKTASVLAE